MKYFQAEALNTSSIHSLLFIILFLYSHICLNCTAYSVSVCFMFDVLSGVNSDDRAFHVAKYII